MRHLAASQRFVGTQILLICVSLCHIVSDFINISFWGPGPSDMLQSAGCWWNRNMESLCNTCQEMLHFTCFGIGCCAVVSILAKVLCFRCSTSRRMLHSICFGICCFVVVSTLHMVPCPHNVKRCLAGSPNTDKCQF